MDLKKYICSERVVMSDQISGVAQIPQVHKRHPVVALENKIFAFKIVLLSTLS